MRSRAWTAALLAGLVVGCGGGGYKEDPLLALSAEESLEQGKALMAEEKYRQAQEYLTHAFEVEPNSPSGREALLLAADSLYLAGGEDNYIRAEAKYRDFQNRFPTSARGDYVLFQVANCLARRMRKPDRDQTVTHKALKAYSDVVTLFPSSEYGAQAREQMKIVENSLAESEYMVARFYYRAGLPTAAMKRLERALEEFPEYGQRDKLLHLLGLTYRRLQRPGDALKTFEQLRAEFPESPYLKEIPHVEPAEATEPAEEAA